MQRSATHRERSRERAGERYEERDRERDEYAARRPSVRLFFRCRAARRNIGTWRKRAERAEASSRNNRCKLRTRTRAGTYAGMAAVRVRDGAERSGERRASR